MAYEGRYHQVKQVKQIQLTSTRVDDFHRVRQLLAAHLGVEWHTLSVQQAACAAFQTFVKVAEKGGGIEYDWHNYAGRMRK